MSNLRRSFAVLFSLLVIALLIPDKLSAHGIKVATTSVSSTCGIGGTSINHTTQGTAAASTSAACDVMYASGGIFLQSVGSAIATLGPNPSVDVMASVTGTPNWTLDPYAEVRASATWYTDIKSIQAPPELPPNGKIPVIFTWSGETQGFDTSISAVFNGKFTTTPGTYNFNLLPGTQYAMVLTAFCVADTTTAVASECQAVADPSLKFNQAAFNAEMAAAGLPTYSLSQYYGFGYSPNMVPEPSTLVLLGSGLLCLAGIGRKRFAR